jgi:hypothetical protein
MKKVIGIYCGNVNGDNEPFWDSDICREKGIGGSETWAVNIAHEFRKMGYHVIVFGNPQYWHFDNDGVEYVPYWMFESRSEYQHYDYLIISRRCDILEIDFECDNVYLMSHEIGIFDKYWGRFATYDQLHMDKVRKIGVLSEWHKNATMKMYPQLKEEQLFITCNGIDMSLYDNIDWSKKRNMMVWSTCLNRGLTFFGQRVLPKVKAEVPDFELKICSYNTDIHGVIPEGEGVKFLGTLNKKELAELQKESSIWALPNYGYNDFGQPLHESFCMTAVENGLAGNAIVCFNTDGIYTTLNGYTRILNIGKCYDETLGMPPTDGEMEKIAEEMAQSMILYLKYHSLCRTMGKQAQKICQKYTWEHAAKTWIQQWESK